MRLLIPPLSAVSSSAFNSFAMAMAYHITARQSSNRRDPGMAGPADVDVEAGASPLTQPGADGNLGCAACAASRADMPIYGMKQSCCGPLLIRFFSAI